MISWPLITLIIAIRYRDGGEPITRFSEAGCLASGSLIFREVVALRNGRYRQTDGKGGAYTQRTGHINTAVMLLYYLLRHR